MTIGGQPIRTVAPVGYPVSLDEVTGHLRVDSNDDLLMILSYLAAAVARVEDYTGLGLLQQTWVQTFPAFANPMILYRRPLLIVGSPAAAATVTYLDSAGATQTLADTVYRLTGIGADRVNATVRLGYGQSWPSASTDEEAVTVTYTVGYGTEANAVPALIRQAILMTVADMYAFRESLHQGSLEELPFGAMELLRQWRPLAVA